MKGKGAVAILLLVRGGRSFSSTSGLSTSRCLVVLPSTEVQLSPRLRRAQLRLSEVQGKLPIGVADGISAGLAESDVVDGTESYGDFTRVAKAAKPYDPNAAEAALLRKPLLWLRRNVELFLPLGAFMFRVAVDVQKGREPSNRRLRARELQSIIANLGPAIIKGGQALASRPDLLPIEYLQELQKLQDRVPVFSTEAALALVEQELGVAFKDVFVLEDPNPIAAASIGQVYKARLVANMDLVAIKIQRPGCEDTIQMDLYVLRFWAGVGTWLLATLGRNVNLVSIIDDFGELIYREIDYLAEAANGKRFGELYAVVPGVFVPKVYPDLCSSKVLTVEFVEGVRLVETQKLRDMGLEPAKLVETLVQCSLRQMLDSGFFHADPHAGNLLARADGKLAFLDFGMMSYLETYQRFAIIEAVVHLVNRDFSALTNLYKKMGFIPAEEDAAPIVQALEAALPDVLDAPVGELNIKNVVDKLGVIFYEYPFTLPPFYIALIRCLGVLEGLAIQVDPDFQIISRAYPYISSRLLTDGAPELEKALQQLIFKEGDVRWDRLVQLVERAGETRDYDVTQAIDKLVDYLLSDKGTAIREQLIEAIIEGSESLGDEATAVIERLLTTQALPSAQDLASSPRLATLARLTDAIASSRSFKLERLLPSLEKLGRDPLSQQAGLDIISAVSERAITRGIRLAFGLPRNDGPGF